MNATNRIKLLSFTGASKTLHITWFAFFLTFVIWFNHAPLMAHLREVFGLTAQQVKTLLILNVAMTIPARIIIGMLVDKFGPRIMYTAVLAIAGVLCVCFALAQSFEQLAVTRFLLGFVGAGFVIGIRMISEWFPAKQLGTAEGIYGGWGNFGSAAAAMTLPTLALIFGGEHGWRYAIGLTGVIGILYAGVYYWLARDTPKESTYFKPKKSGAMEVTSKGDLFLYLFMNIPMYATLGVLTWKLGPSNLGMLPGWAAVSIYVALVAFYVLQSWKIISFNKKVFTETIPEIHRYSFKQVAVLDFAYLLAFGSELAVVSMLPLFFQDTFTLTATTAGLLASAYAFMNLVARPGGGVLSDKFGRKRTLMILIACLAAGYFMISQITAEWPIWLAVVAVMVCSFFVQAGEGAVFAVVPLINRRQTGQIAGMAGAYGNVGAVLFLTVLSFVTPQVFFMVIGAGAVLCVGILAFLKEPEGQIAEVMPDGSVKMIDVS